MCSKLAGSTGTSAIVELAANVTSPAERAEIIKSHFPVCHEKFQSTWNIKGKEITQKVSRKTVTVYNWGTQHAQNTAAIHQDRL